ncbi:nitrate reductase associated protein [Leptolyngbya sp. PCC 6406]|uniref:nitrate reductase associated protein n=1 Tax=Leptolyngbya sp. PCC 6406 TaxID=1173264 RepID=UPI0002AC797E|nr:nitrate reductase associated protein [Leptolyngbya sp. PCC 6406]
MTASPFFQFEADFVQSLRCIPMRVRFKLDTCGVKLKLHHWHQFTAAERRSLVDLPCGEGDSIQSYRDYLQGLVIHYDGTAAQDLLLDPEPPWLRSDLPNAVQAQAETLGITLSAAQWQALSPLQRFALLKLSRPGHENHNFLPALREFGLA